MMKSLKEWRCEHALKALLEFNGPLGQPDPTGTSAPMLQPGMTNGPQNPTMGTQPGMATQQPDETLRSIYDKFIARLHKKKPDDLVKIADIFQKDLNDIMTQQGGVPMPQPTA